MHEIVVTEGIVLGKRGVREADALVSMLTPMGLLRAMARGSRKEESKLRYALEPLTLARFSLVRGKHEWRLTGAEQASRLPPSAPLARVVRLLLRLIPAQEEAPELYAQVKRGFALLSSEPSAELEAVLVLRVLSHLGYLPHTEALAPFIENEFDQALAARALEARGLLVRTINESLRMTGL